MLQWPSCPGRKVIQNKHSTDVASPPSPPLVCVSIHTEGKSYSDLSQVLVLIDPPAWRARRTVGKAREFLKQGNIAEAEALCLEQMEHMHARLNMDGRNFHSSTSQPQPEPFMSLQ